MNITPITLLLSATIADISMTLMGLGFGCFEVNPILASVGWIGLLSGKLTATLFVTYLLSRLRERLGGLAFAPGLVVVVVVLWNALNITAQLLG